MKEEWRSIFYGLGSYEVSNKGNVRRTFKGNKYPAGYILKPQKNKWGHLSVFLTSHQNGNRKHFFVHRLVAFAFLEINPDFKMVLHKDGNPENNHVSNLKWGNNSDNMKDRVKHGWRPNGEKNSSHKLTASQVRRIKNMLKKGMTCTDISKKYPVHRVTISRIKRKINWRHIEKSIETNSGDLK